MTIFESLMLPLIKRAAQYTKLTQNSPYLLIKTEHEGGIVTRATFFFEVSHCCSSISYLLCDWGGDTLLPAILRFVRCQT